MTSRDEFEAWMLSSIPGCDLSTGNHTAYNNVSTHWFYCAWVASRAALVIELPVINERDWAVTSDECAAMREGIEIMARRVESAGLKVGRPPKAAEPERTCPGCGEKGFTANCMQCIPY